MIIAKQQEESILGQHNHGVIPPANGAEVIIHTWNGPDDPEDPFNWSTPYKWVVTIAVCLTSVLGGLCAGSYGAASEAIAVQFHVQNRPFPNVDWGTTSWLVGAAIFPLVIVPLTESIGRMPGYFATLIVFDILLIPQALAQNFATLVAVRLIAGGMTSCAVNMAGGSISDIWRGAEARSLPMSFFGLTGVVGIALGPFMGAAILTIDRNEPWRW